MRILRVDNPPNPWASTFVEYLGEAPRVSFEVFEEETREILAKNESPDVPFRWSVNPYRGCYHGCAYCYARPSHEYLGFGAGTDFERKIVVKKMAPELLRRAFDRPSWNGELIAFSGDTDCYQPLEASWGLTRRCLEVCLEYRNPVSIVTKSALIRRDIDILGGLAREGCCQVNFSVPFIDDDVARAIESYAPAPRLRLRAMEAVAEAGIPVGLLIAPVIPGLNDRQIPAVLKAARDAGAVTAGIVALRLPGSVRPVFLDRLRRALPDRARRVEARIRDIRKGRLYDPRFGKRMRGNGKYWEGIQSLFEVWHRKLGYRLSPPDPDPSPFRRPPAGGQSLLPFVSSPAKTRGNAVTPAGN